MTHHQSTALGINDMTKDVEARAREILLNACRAAMRADAPSSEPYHGIIRSVYASCYSEIDPGPADAIYLTDARARSVIALLLEAAVSADPEQ